jgi:hypothetical protein
MYSALNTLWLDTAVIRNNFGLNKSSLTEHFYYILKQLIYSLSTSVFSFDSDKVSEVAVSRYIKILSSVTLCSLHAQSILICPVSSCSIEMPKLFQLLLCFEIHFFKRWRGMEFVFFSLVNYSVFNINNYSALER